MAKPPAAGAQPSIETVAMSEDEEDEGTNYYYDWDVPLSKSGKQQLSTPNMMMMIQDQKYNIENSSKAQTVVVRRMEVNNSNSFHKKFINPYNKNQTWIATPIIMQNGTTGATRCLFEEAERNNNKPPQNKNKRSRDSYEVDSSSSTSSIIGSISNKKTKYSQAKMKMMDLIQRILAVQDANTTDVYDSCPEVIKKIKDFLRQDGITKEDFCQFCLGVNSNALNHFLASKKQDQAANQVYPRAYGFFEKKRILEGTPKSMLRLKNEYCCSSSQHNGFALTNPNNNNTRQWVFVGDPW